MYSVYAVYDAAGALLYVGASVDVKRRLWQHSSRSPWGRDVERVLVKSRTSKQDAFAFETRAIRLLKPKHNIAVHQGRPSKIAYTAQQADAIIRAWHQPKPNKLSRIAAAREAERILGLEPETIKPEWVRDLVRKFVGTAQRDKPDGWQGITEQEGQGDG